MEGAPLWLQPVSRWLLLPTSADVVSLQGVCFSPEGCLKQSPQAEDMKPDGFEDSAVSAHKLVHWGCLGQLLMVQKLCW